MRRFFCSTASTTALALLCSIAAPSATSAQVSLSFNPNPATPGVPVTVTITNGSNATIQLPSPCTWLQIHAGQQRGPVVPIGAFCPAVIVPVGPDSSSSFVWDQIDGSTGLPVPAGRYWVEARYWDAGFSTLTTIWACLSVLAQNEPSLSLSSGQVRVGQTADFAISAPNDLGAPYAVLFAFDAQNPISLPGVVDLCLSAPVFQIASGVLDASGASGPIPFSIPNDPTLAFSGFHLQGVLAGPAGLPIVEANALALTISP